MATGWPMKTTYANGDVYSASDVNDITGTVNLAGGAQWAAGKNKILNGNFSVNQRNFTSNTLNVTYMFDRWFSDFNGAGTVTFTPQTFTLGAAPVSGYEGNRFMQVVVSGQTAGNYASFSQKIEDVRTLAGQTATISFWAKSGSGTPQIYPILFQRMGTGGSPSSDTSTAGAAQSISTTWTRYSWTVTLPSLSGKTLGTNNNSALELEIMLSGASVAINNNTFQIWGVQVEQGTTATTFTTASGGSPQGELAMCQRYYWRSTATSAYSVIGAGGGNATSTTTARMFLANPVNMRTTPSSIDYGGALACSDGVTLYTTGAFAIQTNSTPAATHILYTHGTAALTQYRWYNLQDNNANTAYVGVSAEL